MFNQLLIADCHFLIAGYEQSDNMPQLRKGLTDFHDLDAIGRIRRDLRG
jgi:hypothetical protein